jgi:hypothetical protein
MKKVDTILKEYVSRLNLDGLKFLSIRLDQRIGSDLAEALDAMSTCNDVDKWLSSAKSCEELYNMIDLAQEYVDRELHKRVPDLVGA